MLSAARLARTDGRCSVRRALVVAPLASFLHSGRRRARARAGRPRTGSRRPQDELRQSDLVVPCAIIPTLLKTHHLGMTAADATVATLSLVGVAIVAAGIGHPSGFYFFAAVAVAGFLAVLTLPGQAAHAEATVTAGAVEPAV